MTAYATVPLRRVKDQDWGHLSALAVTHEVCGYTVNNKGEQHSFGGGHRVRLFTFKGNVHWRMKSGSKLDISEVDA